MIVINTSSDNHRASVCSESQGPCINLPAQRFCVTSGAEESKLERGGMYGGRTAEEPVASQPPADVSIQPHNPLWDGLEWWHGGGEMT